MRNSRLKLVDGASAFIDQSGICQIARRQPIGGSGVLPKATAAHAIDAFAGAQFQDPIDNTASPQKVRA
jgi:hypothetical protein